MTRCGDGEASVVDRAGALSSDFWSGEGAGEVGGDLFLDGGDEGEALFDHGFVEGGEGFGGEQVVGFAAFGEGAGLMAKA